MKTLTGYLYNFQLQIDNYLGYIVFPLSVFIVYKASGYLLFGIID